VRIVRLTRLLPTQLSTLMDNSTALSNVEAEITALGVKLDKLDIDIEAARKLKDTEEVAALRTKEQQLRTKEQQLRKEKQQLRKEKLLLLERQPGAP